MDEVIALKDAFVQMLIVSKDIKAKAADGVAEWFKLLRCTEFSLFSWKRSVERMLKLDVNCSWLYRILWLNSSRYLPSLASVVAIIRHCLNLY